METAVDNRQLLCRLSQQLGARSGDMDSAARAYVQAGREEVLAFDHIPPDRVRTGRNASLIA